MSVWSALGLVAAGVGGGLTGSIAGLASIVTYPALLAFGLSPVGANVTNTAALIFNGIGSTIGSRPELVGQLPRLKRLVPFAMTGGLIGAALALITPSHVFARIVPGLILAAGIAILLPRRQVTPALVAQAFDWPHLRLAVLAIAVYGGYFGAAAGVGLIAILILTTGESLPRSNAAKNVLLGASNLAATVVFAAFGPLRWSAALLVAVGCLTGSRVGPVVVRRLPAEALRVTIGLLGIGLAVVLGFGAY